MVGVFTLKVVFIMLSPVVARVALLSLPCFGLCAVFVQFASVNQKISRRKIHSYYIIHCCYFRVRPSFRRFNRVSRKTNILVKVKQRKSDIIRIFIGKIQNDEL